MLGDHWLDRARVAVSRQPGDTRGLAELAHEPLHEVVRRPVGCADVDQYKGWQRRRLRMRPGLTCLWAISGRDNLDFETWMKLDLRYIDNWSLGLDFRILLLTIPHVLTGRGVN